MNYIDEIKKYSVEHPIGRLSNPALIVIDMQKYFVDRSGRAYLKDSILITPNIEKLAVRFKKNGLPVIFTRHSNKRSASDTQMFRFWNGDLLYGDDLEAQIAEPFLQLSKDAVVIDKEHYSAFENTDLERILRDLNVHDLIITGVMTHLCVDTTARVAFIKGFRPIVVSDATATKSEEMHLAALTNMSHGFAHVVSTEAIQSKLS